jgi:LAS superfamily LD-carboxypeptidase LdcB
MKIKVALLVLMVILVGGGVTSYIVEFSSKEPVVSAVSQTPSPTPTPTPSPTPIQLLCFSESTKALRSSDLESGCLDGEQSLGAYRIDRPADRPTDLNPILLTRFLAAQAAAKKAGFPLHITSGYRSYALQERLFRNAVERYGSEAEASKWVLPADVSHHPWGLALDINYPNDPVSTKWLEVNGYTYGLCRAYENEWWHFEGLSAPGEQCPAMLPDASTTTTD